ncbi:hypothetical protein HDV64DRAFT_237696 [Trichoderma sp. TUCIM 5745]
MLDALPSDISDLYKSMWKGIKPQYIGHASRLFQFAQFLHRPVCAVRGTPIRPRKDRRPTRPVESTRKDTLSARLCHFWSRKFPAGQTSLMPWASIQLILPSTRG